MTSQSSEKQNLEYFWPDKLTGMVLGRVDRSGSHSVPDFVLQLLLYDYVL